MLKERALEFYEMGYNCSQCILLAFSQVYNLPFSEKELSVFCGLNNGFGINEFCSAIVGGILALGLMFEEEVVVELRVIFLTELRKNIKSFYCGRIKGAENGCLAVIAEVCDVLEKIISENKQEVAEL